nr:MAG TPA: protein of unknown function (DUF5365) [Caudoviricetes sp.]
MFLGRPVLLCLQTLDSILEHPDFYGRKCRL